MKLSAKRKISFNHLFAAFLSFIFLFSTATFAQNVGDVREFGPVVIDIEVDWKGNKHNNITKTEVYNSLPAGYVIIGNRPQLISRNNGSYTVSTLAGGSSYIEKHEIKKVYQDKIDFAMKVGKYDIAAKLQQELQDYLSTYTQYESSHNTLRVWAEAHTAGRIYDKWSGHISVKVHVKAMYLGDPNPSILMKKLDEKYPLSFIADVKNQESSLQLSPTIGNPQVKESSQIVGKGNVNRSTTKFRTRKKH